jgi:RNA recognition motif-containing protein
MGADTDLIRSVCVHRSLIFISGHLPAEFKPFGAVQAEVLMDKVTGRSRGFGFVFFADKDGMDRAIEAKHNTEIDGRKISVRSAIPQDQIPPGE